MIHTDAFHQYLRSAEFLGSLGLEEDTELSFSLLGQGEYNINYRFVHPVSGQTLVLRINTGSQMHLDRQIEYEFAALRELEPSGRTPKALFCKGRGELPYGLLVMEYLPGRALRYESDLPIAAGILADIHALPLRETTPLLRPEHPAQAIYDECLQMAEHYLTWDKAEADGCRLIETLIAEIGRLPLSAPTCAQRCIVNTELNSGNFLIDPRGRSYLVDWEKPLISEPAQDLGHFLAPTTTFWKTDVILSPEEIQHFVGQYEKAVGDRLDIASLRERLPLFFTVNCLRGVTWCAMAMREYSQPGRQLLNRDTFSKIKAYLSADFLENILRNYVRRDFLKGGVR